MFGRTNWRCQIIQSFELTGAELTSFHCICEPKPNLTACIRLRLMRRRLPEPSRNANYSNHSPAEINRELEVSALHCAVIRTAKLKMSRRARKTLNGYVGTGVVLCRLNAKEPCSVQLLCTVFSVLPFRIEIIQLSCETVLRKRRRQLHSHVEQHNKKQNGKKGSRGFPVTHRHFIPQHHCYLVIQLIFLSRHFPEIPSQIFPCKLKIFSAVSHMCDLLSRVREPNAIGMCRMIQVLVDCFKVPFKLWVISCALPKPIEIFNSEYVYDKTWCSWTEWLFQTFFEYARNF